MSRVSSNGNTQLFLCVALFISSCIASLSALRIDIGKFEVDYSPNVSQLCLETLISLEEWPFHDFEVIFNESYFPYHSFLKRFPNIRWKLHSSTIDHLNEFSNVILFTKNFDSFKEILMHVNLQKLDGRSKIVVHLAQEFSSVKEIEETSKGVPAAMWKLDKTNVLYLVHLDRKIALMTYYPFAKDCQVGELEVLDICSEKGFAANRSELFPEKMLDIRGCVQNHSLFFSEESSLQLDREFNDKGDVILGGIGGRVMTIAAEKMNMKLHAVLYPTEFWPLLNDMVANGESLFLIAGTIPLAGQAEILDLDSGYMEESFGFGYIVDNYEISWSNIVWPLSNQVWVCVLCTLVLFIGLICISNRLHRDQNGARDNLTVLNGLGIFLATSRPLPRHSFGRYSFGIWIIYSYLIHVSYNTGLISFLTTPNEVNVINTFQELLDSRIDFGGGLFHKEFYNDPSDPVMMKIYNNFHVWSAKESIFLFRNKRCVTGVHGSFVARFNSDNKGNTGRKIRTLKEKAFTYQVPISMKRGSPFVVGVRRYTSMAIQGGFHRYWLDHYTRNSSLVRVGEKPPTIISVQHLKGILYLYILGLMSSLVVFIGELIHRNCFYRTLPFLNR